MDRANWEARLYSTVSSFPSAVELPSRGELYRYVSRELLDGGAKTIDYLEFGVYRGETFREWCALNQNPHSRFFGFDSFEGLPEDWNPRQPKGAFDTGGRAPELDDARAEFVVGLFQHSLPGFLRSYQAQDQLVLHVDCDLYSSTLYCLSTPRPTSSRAWNSSANCTAFVAAHVVVDPEDVGAERAEVDSGLRTD